jgi:carboxymethylenebutenolidase
METKQSNFPPQLIELYNLYIHGEINRRQFMESAKKFAVGGVTVAALFQAMQPNYALGQVVAPNDSRLKTETATVQSPQGNGRISGYLVRPANATGRLPGVLVIHENRGLNPHIQDIARRFALANFMAFAPDALTTVGGYPGDDERGGQLFGQIDRNKLTEDFLAAAMWLKNRPDSNGKVGATGFCFGGGVANTLAVRMGADLGAAVPFYGAAPAAADVSKIKAAILVLHGGNDTRLVEGWPAYEAALKANGVKYDARIYPGAGHGFNNDSTKERFNEAASKDGMERAIAWFNTHLRTS